MATSTKDMSPEEWEQLAKIGALFTELRLESGLTQRQAARKAGTSQARVSYLERGEKDVMITSLHRWAKFYGYQLDISLVPIEDEFMKQLREAQEGLGAENGELEEEG